MFAVAGAALKRMRRMRRRKGRIAIPLLLQKVPFAAFGDDDSEFQTTFDATTAAK